VRLSHPVRVIVLALSFHLVATAAAFASAGQDARLSSGLAARATAVSGPVISLSVSYHDFGRLNAGTSSGTFDITITNTGDAPLTIFALSHTKPGAGFEASIGSLPVTIPPEGSTLLTTSYTAAGSGPVSDNVIIDSDAVNGDIPALLQGVSNTPPFFDPALASEYSATAFVAFSLTAGATDSEDDAMSWSIASVPPLPVGATFEGTTGVLSWTPNPSDAGDYAVTITVDDGLAHTDGSFTLHALVTNNPPTADPGGPYTQVAGEPVEFNGSASSDPDGGQTLSFAWDFGDGLLGTGANPSHTYPFAGFYTVTLTVTDNGSPVFSHTAATVATIINYFPLDIVLPSGALPIIKTNGNGLVKFGIECLTRPVTDIDQTTIRISTTYPNAGTVSEIKVVPEKLPKIGDINGNRFYDLDITIRSADIKPLLIHVPKGALVTLVFTAYSGEDERSFFRGAIDLTKAGPAGVTAAAAPNPFKPETNIQYAVRESGPVSIRIFSADGRLVRTLKHVEYAAAGGHEARWNGLNDEGQRVVSGVYFVKTTALNETSVLKLVVMK
jgi:PKD domain-containing protein/putative Ig domain-containing protein/flagellar hook capping protein FlgD/HYDIN/CFA65/VesB family protein